MQDIRGRSLDEKAATLTCSIVQRNLNKKRKPSEEILKVLQTKGEHVGLLAAGL